MNTSQLIQNARIPQTAKTGHGPSIAPPWLPAQATAAPIAMLAPIPPRLVRSALVIPQA